MSNYREPFETKLRMEIAAPLILLGQVLDVRDIGKPTKSAGDPRIEIQLTSVTVLVETVIKGSVDSDIVKFLYFAYARSNAADLGIPRYTPSIGQRRIYFLRQDMGKYRSVGDVADYTLRIYSGTHASAFCQGNNPGCCIARLLLVPGPGLNSKWFAASLSEAAYVAEVLCSRTVSLDLMQRLAQNPDNEISTVARQIVAYMKPR
jgi:hypothetical protein